MATQRPISTISYNTEAFLSERLQELYKGHVISEWLFIPHKGEDGGKDHIHLYLQPNRRLDPMGLQELLQEYIAGEDKPRGVRPFRPSKQEDWLLYALHDEKYLKSKYGEFYTTEDGKLPYTIDNVRASEGVDLEELLRRAKTAQKYTAPNLVTRLELGDSALDLVKEGVNPMLAFNLARGLNGTEFESVSRQLSEVQAQLNRLLEAIHAYGLVVVSDDEGKPKLEPKPKPIKPRGVAPSGEAPGTASGNASERFIEIPAAAAALPEQFTREDNKQ